MNRVRCVLAVAIMLVLTQAVWAQAQDLADKTALGADIVGHKEGDVYVITSGTLSGDMTGKTVVIGPGLPVTIGPSMKGTVSVKDGSVTIAGISASGTGSCDSKGCTFLQGSTISTDIPIQGAFRIKNDNPASAGKIDILTSATVGQSTLSNVKDLQAVGTGYKCTVDSGSVIDGTAFNNRAIIGFTPGARTLEVSRPQDQPADYVVRIDRLADGTTIKDNDVRIIRFMDKSSVTELYAGAITKKSDTDFVCNSDAKFKNDQNVNFIVHRTTSYVAGPSLPSDVGTDYIWSDIDKKTGKYALELKTQPGAKIAVDLEDNNPYRSIKANMVGSVALFVEKDAEVSIDNGALALYGGKQKKLQSEYESVVGDHTDILTKQQLTRCESSACKTASYTPAAKLASTPSLVQAPEPTTQIGPPTAPVVPPPTSPALVQPATPVIPTPATPGPTIPQNVQPATPVVPPPVSIAPATPQNAGATTVATAPENSMPELANPPTPTQSSLGIPAGPSSGPSATASDATATPPQAVSAPAPTSQPTIDDLRKDDFVQSMNGIINHALGGSQSVDGIDNTGQRRTFTYDFDRSEAGGLVDANSKYTLVEPAGYENRDTYLPSSVITSSVMPFHLHLNDLGQAQQGPSPQDMAVANQDGNIVASLDRDHSTGHYLGTYTVFYYTQHSVQVVGKYRLPLN